MEFVANAQVVVGLITAIVTLIGTAVPMGIVIFNLFKGKKASEVMAILMEIIDAAVVEAEKSDLPGIGKKDMVKKAVIAGLKSQNIDAEQFMDQLDVLIDQSVASYNQFKTAKK